MHIIHVAAELAPIAKVGGLGDVVYGLSKELVREGHKVEIILPKYSTIQAPPLQKLHIAIPRLKTASGEVALWEAEFENLPIKLVEPLDLQDAFTRGKIYGFPDDLERFLVLCHTAIAYFLKIHTKPDVVHIHDWHTALIPALMSQHIELSSIKTVLTLHNLEYQGECSSSLLEKLEISTPSPSPSFLEVGIIHANAITTVSPTYEKEIKEPGGGCGLEPLLIENAHKLTGILNGIDCEFWNPHTDPLLFTQYPLSPMQALRKGKQANKEHLRRRLGLANSHGPLVASVTRLASQKGPKLIKHALLRTLEKGGQFVLLGASGPPDILHDFTKLKEELLDNPNVSINVDQDEALAHLIYAAADLLVIPSLFEPCGLTQLIAMRYGTIPLVRKTGGLVDTVFDCDTSDKPPFKRNGFTFDFPDNEGVDWALNRALAYYKNNHLVWETLIQNGAALDFSWRQSVQSYLQVYQAGKIAG